MNQKLIYGREHFINNRNTDNTGAGGTVKRGVAGHNTIHCDYVVWQSATPPFSTCLPPVLSLNRKMCMSTMYVFWWMLFVFVSAPQINISLPPGSMDNIMMHSTFHRSTNDCLDVLKKNYILRWYAHRTSNHIPIISSSLTIKEYTYFKTYHYKDHQHYKLNSWHELSTSNSYNIHSIFLIYFFFFKFFFFSPNQYVLYVVSYARSNWRSHHLLSW